VNEAAGDVRTAAVEGLTAGVAAAAEGAAVTAAAVVAAVAVVPAEPLQAPRTNTIAAIKVTDPASRRSGRHIDSILEVLPRRSKSAFGRSGSAPVGVHEVWTCSVRASDVVPDRAVRPQAAGRMGRVG
jgi:hypothetical protein